MKIIAIAAVGRNWEIGKHGDLLWRIPEDMHHFQETTWGHPIVMGRKTFESLPGLLKGRYHYVLTRHPEPFIQNFESVYTSIEEVIAHCEAHHADKLFVIGGGEVYHDVIERGIAHEVLLTRIDDEDTDADTFFPDLDRSPFYRDIHIKALNDHSWVYTYHRTDLLSGA